MPLMSSTAESHCNSDGTSGGLAADDRFNVPRMAMTVAPIVTMMPGVYAFEMIVLFNHGRMLEALQASGSCGFVVGALAMGLATARFFKPK
ncbi:MAG: threonine/serine exporter family protein [Xanthobacteraceae bacterium]